MDKGPSQFCEMSAKVNYWVTPLDGSVNFVKCLWLEGGHFNVSSYNISRVRMKNISFYIHTQI